eukprot:2647966-Prymnesium_polylepis.1
MSSSATVIARSVSTSDAVANFLLTRPPLATLPSTARAGLTASKKRTASSSFVLPAVTLEASSGPL